MSREEIELDQDYTRARRSLFVVLSLLIAGMLFGLFDMPQAGPPAGDAADGSLGHSVLGMLFVFIAAYLAAPPISNPKS